MSRTLLRSSAAASFAFACSIAALSMAPAQAQTYPSRTIEWISHSSAGSGTDLFNRNVSDLLQREKIFNVPFIHSNRVGGNGVVAYNYVKSKKGDPHVVIAMSVTVILTASARPELELGLDTITPISRFAQDPQVVAVRTESKFKTFKELVDAGSKEPGSVVAGVTGPTGSGRAALWLIEKETGARFKFVNFKGGGEAVLATVGGHVEITTENMSEMMPLLEAKKMRLLAVTGERRFKNAPDVPTLKELGYNIFLATGRGWAMPPGVPKDAAAIMEAALKKVHDSPAYKEYSERNMFEDAYLGSAEFAEHLVKQRVEQIEFLKHLGVIK
jgi:tripartite-type tricarboxylate transporter receptor subunit TctC